MAASTDRPRRFRLSRDRGYRRRVTAAVVLSVAAHLIAVLLFAPFREHIPLVRNIGYYGPTRILPEISVIREIGPDEREEELSRGAGGRSAFRVVPITVTDWEVAEGEAETRETGDESDEVVEEGLELLRQLELSLPQPTSREMVVEHLVKPRYPASSRAGGVEGVVVFRLHVTRTGEVANIWLLRSEVDRACEQAARKALRRWRYRPYVVDGVPVDFLGDQPIRFRLYDVETGVTGGVRSHEVPSP